MRIARSIASTAWFHSATIATRTPTKGTTTPERFASRSTRGTVAIYARVRHGLRRPQRLVAAGDRADENHDGWEDRGARPPLPVQRALGLPNHLVGEEGEAVTDGPGVD